MSRRLGVDRNASRVHGQRTAIDRDPAVQIVGKAEFRSDLWGSRSTYVIVAPRRLGVQSQVENHCESAQGGIRNLLRGRVPTSLFVWGDAPYRRKTWKEAPWNAPLETKRGLAGHSANASRCGRDAISGIANSKTVRPALEHGGSMRCNRQPRSVSGKELVGREGSVG
jgi:hypothetical protein